MHALLAVLPAVIIFVSAIADLFRRANKPSPPSKPSSTQVVPARPTVSRTPTRRPAVLTGYAGRQAQANLPEHARAIESAGSRLASGAEYPTIVAERAADARFAAEVRTLIQSEPKSSARASSMTESRSQSNSILELQQKISIGSGDAAPLISAIVLAEVLGNPRCRRKR